MRGALLLIPGLLALAAPPAGMAVREAVVRFDGGGRARLRMVGDLTVTGALDVEALRITLGPATLLDGLPADARVRVRPGGDWRVFVPRPFGGRGRLALTLSPQSGVFTLDARGWDGSALLAAGPESVPCAVSAGGSGGDDVFDFEVRGRRWSFRRTTPPHPLPGGGGPPGQGTYAELWGGVYSDITTFRFEVFKTEPEWQAFWSAHGGVGTAPAVDFSADMVVGLWLGTRPTGGYSVTIDLVVPATVIGAPCTPEGGCPPTGATVGATEHQPGASCIVTMAPIAPFRVVRAPRVEGPVILELSSSVYECR
jgi:hypothetical protein